VTNAGPSGQRFALVGATAAAMGMRTDANAPEESSCGQLMPGSAKPLA
jgi:hypothetical protein